MPVENTTSAAGTVSDNKEIKGEKDKKQKQTIKVKETVKKKKNPEVKKNTNPTLIPSVAWLPDPVEVPASIAATASDMKPYTDIIPGTKVTFDMVPVQGGVFMLGSPVGEKDREDCEGPQVKVEIAPFWMGKCEVTWDEYLQWMSGLDAAQRKSASSKPAARDKIADAITRPTNPYSDMTFGMGSDGFPAICMTQFAANVYCKWLSAKTGRYYRLPTEAEWEYACRAGTTTAYSFGDDPEKIGEYAWYVGNNDEKYHKVGLKKPNPWGLFDMHGNVAEWVLGSYSEDAEDGYKQFASGGVVKNPLVGSKKNYGRVVRGGSWIDEAQWLRSATRTASHPSWKEQDPQFPQSIWYLTDAQFVGFRVVRPLKTPGEKEGARYDVDEFQKKAMLDYNKFKGI